MPYHCCWKLNLIHALIPKQPPLPSPGSHLLLCVTELVLASEQDALQVRQVCSLTHHLQTCICVCATPNAEVCWGAHTLQKTQGFSMLLWLAPCRLL